MKYLSLHEIEIEVNNLARIIKSPKQELPTYGYSRDLAYLHIEQDINGYHYVTIERGQEQERHSTKDIHAILFWIFDTITSSMGFKYELNIREIGKDCRRIAFKKKEELMKMLNPQWGDLAERKHKSILSKYPFDDLAGLRATYCSELRLKGLTEREIDRLAFEKYPESKE